MFETWKAVWDDWTPRKRASWQAGVVATLILAIFVALAIKGVVALLVLAVFLFMLARALGAEPTSEAPLPLSDGLGQDSERVESRTKVIGRGMTREQACAFIDQRIQQHGFLRVKAEITTYTGQNGALRYMVTLDGHVPPKPQTNVSNAWLPP